MQKRDLRLALCRYITYIKMVE